jgi:hypothetical protein
MQVEVWLQAEMSGIAVAQHCKIRQKIGKEKPRTLF